MIDKNDIVIFLKTHCVCPIQIKFLNDSNIEVLLGINVPPFSGTTISSSPLLQPDDPLLTEFRLDLHSALKYAKKCNLGSHSGPENLKKPGKKTREIK